jgi:hypothetical protein
MKAGPSAGELRSPAQAWTLAGTGVVSVDPAGFRNCRPSSMRLPQNRNKGFGVMSRASQRLSATASTAVWYKGSEREGRIQSAERAVPTHPN